MSNETVTRTYSAQISDETFQTIKELEKATGIPREHIFTAMVTIMADKNSKVVNEVVMKAHDIQSDALKAKMGNGGFFAQPETKPVTPPANPVKVNPSGDNKSPK